MECIWFCRCSDFWKRPIGLALSHLFYTAYLCIQVLHVHTINRARVQMYHLLVYCCNWVQMYVYFEVNHHILKRKCKMASHKFICDCTSFPPCSCTDKYRSNRQIQFTFCTSTSTHIAAPSQTSATPRSLISLKLCAGQGP